MLLEASLWLIRAIGSIHSRLMWHDGLSRVPRPVCHSLRPLPAGIPGTYLSFTRRASSLVASCNTTSLAHGKTDSPTQGLLTHKLATPHRRPLHRRPPHRRQDFFAATRLHSTRVLHISTALRLLSTAKTRADHASATVLSYSLTTLSSLLLHNTEFAPTSRWQPRRSSLPRPLA